ncbi:hypothetical protein [Bosea psychrotolerans]|uniref:hypothetical protein n=1 Tax=Bosea psychrotolerans TaxID=1871628 RepID=UPI0011AFECF3|nr:hypothetical protein [Bosea psychrotolerans]
MNVSARDVEELILPSLELVGSKKSVGYLPLPTIRKFLNNDKESLIRRYVSRGLNCVIFSPRKNCIKGGALFVYGPVEFKKILDQFHIEDDVEDFLQEIAAKWLSQDDARMPIIRALYGDREGAPG